MVNIIPVDLSNHKEIRKFVRFPFQLYKDCPQWVPPLVQDAINSFDPNKHPFFQLGELQLFLAEENGKTVGRIAALNNHHYNKYLNQKTAFFGFYDAINDSRNLRNAI